MRLLIVIVVNVGTHWRMQLRAVTVGCRRRKMSAGVARGLMMMIAIGLLQPGREQELDSSLPFEKMLD